MSSLDVTGSQPAAAPEAQAVQLEKLGPWLMVGYWLAMLGIFVVGGLASGG